MHKIIDSLKYIKLKDLFAPFIFLLAIIPALVYKTYLATIKKPLWLICEDGDTARDNGYYFYKYMREKHPEVNCKYVIRKSSGAAYDKIMKLGKKPIETSSFAHYVSYLAAKWNISNHKHGNPNQPLFYVIHVTLGLINNRVFLQHGVIFNDIPCYHYKESKFKYFVTSVEREYEFIKNTFGYEHEAIINVGLPRFDTLTSEKLERKTILIMPTWRNWLGRETNSLHRQEDFKETDYFKNWNSLLTNKSFIEHIEKNNINVLFYPHQHMQKYLKDFYVKSRNIKLLDTSTDIQKVLKESGIMITDFSSVHVDFAYMRKPILYFQFDYDDYYNHHLKHGYFNWEKDGFGHIYKTVSDLVEGVKETDWRMSEDYVKRVEEFFSNNDKNNCQRLYEVLVKAARE